MAIGRVMRYLNEHRLFTSLPSYDEVIEGLVCLDPRRPSNPSSKDLVFQLDIPEHLRGQKTRQFAKVASHLWGGHEQTARSFEDIEIVKIDELAYARTHPLKVTLSFPGGVSRTVYAKRFDEKRLVGLELENILGPGKYNYSSGGEAIYEAELPGVEAVSVPNVLKVRPEYQEELVRLDYRAFLTLMGDINPFNYLVETTEQRQDTTPGFRMRPIDFDKLFTNDKIGEPLRDGFLIGPDERPIAIATIGEEKYNSLLELQRQIVRRRYLQQENRIKALLEIVGDSEDCNADRFKLRDRLAIYYGENGSSRAEAFYDAENMGELLGLHLTEQLEI